MDSQKSNRKKKRWYWWTGLLILVFITGIPYALLKAFLFLVEGLPRHAVSVLLDVPLNWFETILVTIPEALSTNLAIGIGMVVGIVGIPVFCIWLMKKGSR